MENTFECRDINGAVHEVPASEFTFRPSLYGVIVKDSKVLLHRYADGYDFPGGGINIGESLDDAFAREVKEETGLTVKRGESLKVVGDLFIHPGTKKPYHTILLYFTGHDPQGEISTEFFDDHEKEVASAAEWVAIETIPTLKFFNPLTPEENAEMIRRASGA